MAEIIIFDGIKCRILRCNCNLTISNLFKWQSLKLQTNKSKRRNKKNGNANEYDDIE